MGEQKKLYRCVTCHTTMNSDNFYKSNNLEKYKNTDGYLPQCKKCLTMNLDNWNPETFALRNPKKPDEECILEQLDIPWIPDEWNTLLARYGKSGHVTGTTILGRYISKMKLTQYKEYRYKDTQFLQEMADAKIRETMKRQGYEAAEIEKAIQEGRMPVPERPDFDEDGPEAFLPIAKESQQDYGLTQEDKIYLANKWGKTYREEEWIQLERFYMDMTDAFNIQTPAHRDTLKHICKVSLKMNQLLDIGDIDGYQKLSKAYDGLMKSGNFTAAQNKADAAGYLETVSELVTLCESHGFMPRFYTDKPQDKVDRVLQDLQSYNRNLIMEETNLGNMIEAALHQIEEDNKKASIINVDDDMDEDGIEADNLEHMLFEENQDNEDALVDDDLIEFNEFKNSSEEEL